MSVLALTVSMPAVALADEVATDALPIAEENYSGLEDLRLRRDITDLAHYYFIQPEKPASTGGEFAADTPYLDAGGGSGGGYVSFASPATSTFFGEVPEERQDSFMDGVEFGVDWRPDVSGAKLHDRRRLGRGLSGGEIDRVGVRADLTASMRDEIEGDAGSTAWRVTGMLGSTSLSLLAGEDGLLPDTEGGGLLWDIGVGWSSGAMSVNAGYQSAYSLDENGADGSAIAVLSLGADYAILPGLSVYGEFNVVDGPPAENEAGLGTVVIVGTGVSF